MSRHHESNSHYDYYASESHRPEQYTPTSAPYASRSELPPPQAGPYYGYPSAHGGTQPPPPPPPQHSYYANVQQQQQQPPPPPGSQWRNSDSPYYNDGRRYPDAYPPPHPDPALRGAPTQAGYQQPTAPYGTPYSANPFPQSYGPRTRRRPKEQARAACSNCKRDHVSCDNSRPCRRCVAGCKESSCEDVPPKKRGRPKVRIDAVTSAAGRQPMLAVRGSDRTWQPTDKTEISTKDDVDGPGLPPARPGDASTQFPPASYGPYRNQTLPPLATTASASSSTSPRPNTVAGSDPSPLTLSKLGQTSHLAESWDSRSATSLATPPELSPSRAHFGQTSAVVDARGSSGKGLARPTAPTAVYTDRAPTSLPPIASRPQDTIANPQAGPKLPPLTTLESVKPESPRSNGSGRLLSPTITRSLPSQSQAPPSSYSWKAAPRPSSQSSNQRGRSVESQGSVERRADPQAAAGQRRPSEGAIETAPADGQRKRQKLTLGEILH